MDAPTEAASDIQAISKDCVSKGCTDTGQAIIEGLQNNAAAPAVLSAPVTTAVDATSGSTINAPILQTGANGITTTATGLEATSTAAASKANTDSQSGKQKAAQELQSTYATNPQMAQQAIAKDQSTIDRMNQRAQQQHSAAKNSASGAKSSGSTILKVGAAVGAGVLAYTAVQSYNEKKAEEEAAEAEAEAEKEEEAAKEEEEETSEVASE